MLLVEVLCLPVFLVSTARAQEAWIADILANPSRFWNRTVTLVGQVQDVTANPAGTTRGTYTLLDESCPNPLTIRTSDLPPVGRTYSVTGIVIQDATSTAPILKEVSRSAPGMASITKFLLIGGIAICLVLLIVLIVLLVKPKQKAAAPAETIRPSPQATIRPGPQATMRPSPSPVAPQPAPGGTMTTKIPTPPAPPYASAAPDKTQAFMRLGADIIVEKGPDKGKEFPLHKLVMTIGRPGARKNDIELTDDTVSKDQASIYYDITRKIFSIANESSTNPTKVNGYPISGPTIIENDVFIEMGRTALRFKKS